MVENITCVRNRSRLFGSKILLKKIQSYEYKIISMALERALRGTEVELHTFCGKSICVRNGLLYKKRQRWTHIHICWSSVSLGIAGIQGGANFVFTDHFLPTPILQPTMSAFNDFYSVSYLIQTDMTLLCTSILFLQADISNKNFISFCVNTTLC